MTFSASDIDLIDQHLDLLKHSASEIHLANEQIDLLNQADNDLAPLPLSRYYRPRPTPYYRPPKSPRGAPRPKEEPPLSPVYALSPEYTPTSPTSPPARPPANPTANYPSQSNNPPPIEDRGPNVPPGLGAQSPVVEDHQVTSSDEEPELIWDSKPDRRQERKKERH